MKLYSCCNIYIERNVNTREYVNTFIWQCIKLFANWKHFQCFTAFGNSDNFVIVSTLTSDGYMYRPEFHLLANKINPDSLWSFHYVWWKYKILDLLIQCTSLTLQVISGLQQPGMTCSYISKTGDQSPSTMMDLERGTAAFTVENLNRALLLFGTQRWLLPLCFKGPHFWK